VLAKIKFCGMMRGQDAALAARARAAYLGVVFARDPRAVTHVSAREVVAAAAGVPVLGVFADQSPDEILRMAVSPEIVDVSSGVERLPGIKDPQKITSFVEAVFAHSPVS
jgi:indole-3-glycerol phosphate synthase/phosphoribosylanthranilate isomerase